MALIDSLDLNLLRVFDAVWRERSVANAADRLALTPPAVSNALKRLRLAVDDPLFVRTRHGMEPTPFACTLRTPVQLALAHIRDAFSCSSEFDALNSQRTFTLLMNDVGAASFLPGIVKRVTKEAPNIEIFVRETNRRKHEDALDSGAADIAIGRLMLSNAFQSEQIATSPYVVVLDATNPLVEHHPNGRISISPSNYFAADHIDVSPRASTPNPVDRQLEEGIPRRRIALSLPYATSLMNIITGTHLIATVPDRTIDFLCSSGKLVWVPLPIHAEPNVVSMWWHKRDDRDAGHLWIRNIIMDVARQWKRSSP